MNSCWYTFTSVLLFLFYCVNLWRFTAELMVSDYRRPWISDRESCRPPWDMRSKSHLYTTTVTPPFKPEPMSTYFASEIGRMVIGTYSCGITILPTSSKCWYAISVRWYYTQRTPMSIFWWIHFSDLRDVIGWCHSKPKLNSRNICRLNDDIQSSEEQKDLCYFYLESRVWMHLFVSSPSYVFFW